MAYNGGYPGGAYRGNGGYPGAGHAGGGWAQAPPPPQQGYYPPPQGYPPPSGPPQGWGQGTNLYAPPQGPPPNHQYPADYRHQNQYAPPPGPPGGAQRPPSGYVHAGPQNSGFNYQYSQCTGKKKALLIGINYPGTSAELRGCHNDAKNMQRFLIQRYGYKADDIVMLLDGPGANHRSIPTRANMTAAMGWLVQGAQPNDSLFFHYSGHGGQTKNTAGDEADGYDETIYPCDFKSSGQITDNELHDRLVKPLPPGCRLTALFDSCHSATALDLPYIYDTKGNIKEPNLLAEAGSGILSAGMSYARGDVGGALKGLFNLGKTAMNGGKAEEITKQTKMSPADVVMFSGCKDNQTSADASIAAQATGAMSYAFIASMSKYSNLTYNQLLNAIRDELAGKYDQKASLHPLRGFFASFILDCGMDNADVVFFVPLAASAVG